MVSNYADNANQNIVALWSVLWLNFSIIKQQTPSVSLFIIIIGTNSFPPFHVDPFLAVVEQFFCGFVEVRVNPPNQAWLIALVHLCQKYETVKYDIRAAPAAFWTTLAGGNTGENARCPGFVCSNGGDGRRAGLWWSSRHWNEVIICFTCLNIYFLEEFHLHISIFIVQANITLIAPEQTVNFISSYQQT